VRLRRKITIAFFLVSSAVSVLLAVFLYRFIKQELGNEVRGRLKDMAHLGAAEVELDSYQKLLAQLGELDDKQVIAIEQSPEYKEISSHLRMIRAAEPALVHYAYLLVPTADPDKPKFVVDADVLDFEAREARGEALPENESISHFNQVYDLSGANDIPLMRKALAECTPQQERDFVYDEKFKVSSVSAYMPLTDDDGHALHDAAGHCLGVLGLDITDRKMRAALDDAGGLALKISLGMIALTLLVSIGLGTLLTRPILALSTTVKRFADKDFGARTSVRSNDEVGQLGENFNQMAATIQLHSEHLEDLVKVRTKELSEEKQTSERLLLNVLPGPIADRLKGGENLIVDRFESVTVLFADIVGFTALSALTSPEKLVTMLNELFSMFDRLAERHGLEKIKTIGDAYMVVAGIPQPVADHAVAIAHMALDMLTAIADYAKRTDSELTIRVGVHTGPVVAGVIGEKKFIYDLWGDTVNTASRMESHGLPGRVHVSAAAYELLKATFELEARGEIEIKGKGVMRTYLITRAMSPRSRFVSQPAIA
jgi:class 3 adenylate cyclase